MKWVAYIVNYVYKTNIYYGLYDGFLYLAYPIGIIGMSGTVPALILHYTIGMHCI